MRCPICGSPLDDDNYCDECVKFFEEDELNGSNFDEDDDFDFDEDNDFDDDYEGDDGFDFDEDYDSMIDSGDEVCLNCTFWSVSPYGASHGMICRKGYLTEGPSDSCSEFVQEHHFANYGNGGEFQFDETKRNAANKLGYWKNSR